jgi:hypothetical protein
MRVSSAIKLDEHVPSQAPTAINKISRIVRTNIAQKLFKCISPGLQEEAFAKTNLFSLGHQELFCGFSDGRGDCF